MKRYVIALIVLISPLVFAQQPTDAEKIQQLQQAGNSLNEKYLAEVEKVESLSAAAAGKTKTINAMQDLLNRLAPACVSSVESLDKSKTFDLQTLKVMNKPEVKK